MENTAIQAIVGLVMPPVIDLINTKITDTKVRYIVSLLTSLILGLLFSWNELDWQNIFASASIIFAASQTTYNLYWKNSSTREALQTRINQ
jgi:hypothetical protein